MPHISDALHSWTDKGLAGHWAGTSFKRQHFDQIAATDPSVGWFEVHPENFMMAGGPALQELEAVRSRFALSFHSVGLSLGSADGVNRAHLERLAGLCARFEPAFVSDHLAWVSGGGVYFNDLLPVVYDQTALDRFCQAVDLVQNRLGRQILVENPSRYGNLAQSEMTECEFLNHLSKRSGCGLLLDVNNVFVSSRNLGFDALSYLRALDLGHVGEVHLAGHAAADWMGRQMLIDDHGSSITDDVWHLYEGLLAMLGPLPTLIEWDNNLPDFATLEGEARKAETLIAQSQAGGAQHACG